MNGYFKLVFRFMLILILLVGFTIFLSGCEEDLVVKPSYIAGGDHSYQIIIDENASFNIFGQPDSTYNFSGWDNIISVTTGDNNAGAIKKDGTVIVTGSNKYGACDTLAWEDIVMLDFDECSAFGLKRNGSVLTTEFIDTNVNSAHLEVIKDIEEVTTWTNIQQIAMDSSNIIGVRKNGRVEIVALTFPELEEQVKKWKDIKTINASAYIVAGIKYNGEIKVAACDLIVDSITDEALGRLNELKGAIEVHISQSFIVGLLPDNSVRVVNLINSVEDESIKALDGTTDVIDINSQGGEIFILREDYSVLVGGTLESDDE